MKEPKTNRKIYVLSTYNTTATFSNIKRAYAVYKEIADMPKSYRVMCDRLCFKSFFAHQGVEIRVTTLNHFDAKPYSGKFDVETPSSY